MMPPEQESPSYARRQALRAADAGNAMRIVDSYPLGNYFAISVRLLDAFQKAVDERELDHAYVYGVRFCEFSLKVLPKHKEWRRKNVFAKEKRRNVQQVDKVLSMMEVIKQRMDAEEIILQEKMQVEKERRERAERECRKRKEEEEEERAREEDRRRELQRKREQEQKEDKANIERSVRAKLLAMKPRISPTETEKAAEENAEKEEGPTEVVTTTAPSPHTLPKEQATIHQLQQAIESQEARLARIESVQIPTLLTAAKAYLRQAKRKEALHCLARKKKLEQQMDVSKAAIFNMETQMFMLENAMEDRQVQKAMKEAAHVMGELQQSIGDPTATTVDLTDLTASFSALDQNDDEELLDELEEWLSPEPKENQAEDANISILSLPAAPSTPATSDPVKEADSLVRNLTKAVLG